MEFEIQAPEKSIYKFNEVASITGVKPYVLRFWESEFEEINPLIDEVGQKYYAPFDIDCIEKIKVLLFENKMSIPEAKLELTKLLSPFNNDSHSVGIDLESNSIDLKIALEKIIDGHSTSAIKAESLANKVKEEFVLNESKFSDRDIVNLVSAKKKLSLLLGKINSICEDKNW